MASVGVIGGGSFGTALACVLHRAGHDIVIWAREPEVVETLNREHRNPLFLPDVALPRDIRATSELGEACKDQSMLFLAVPAQHVRSVAGVINAHLGPQTPVVSCSKGIERGSNMLMPEVLLAMLPHTPVGVLSGPSFAREIAADLPCGVALAFRDWATGETVARAIANPRFCIHLTDDVIGVAFGGVMKNVIAIAGGIVAGRGLGENAHASIIAVGFYEAIRLGIIKGARAETFSGLSGIGDLLLTANSAQSRNRSLGLMLGQGRPLAAIMGEQKQVTEGFYSVEAIVSLARSLHLELPVTEAVDSILNRGVDIDVAISRFMSHLPPLCRTGADR